MAIINDFKSFIARGNVMDLAVGMIIGAAFTTIVKSLVNDIIMPVIGIFTEGVDFSNMFIALDGTRYDTLAKAQEAGVATINYGLFINAVVYFFIVAVFVFFVVRGIGSLKAKADDPEDTTVETPADIKLLTEIRDALVKDEKRSNCLKFDM